MPWLEVHAGHFRRPIGENEKFIKAVGDRAHAAGREHWSITAKASFKLTKPLRADDLKTKLRYAWQALRYEHPSIASTADEEWLNYIVPEENALEKWCNYTFFVHEEEINADDLVSSLKPSRYVEAHYLVRSSELLLHSAHWRTDGFGALQLLNAFFDVFSALPEREFVELEWGQEVARLVPSIEEVLGLPEAEVAESETVADHYISTVGLVKGAVGLTYKGNESTLPGGTRSARISLSESNTKAIFQACEARKISVLSAIHASVAAITYAGAATDSMHKPYTSTMRFGLRPHLPKQYAAPQFASALYTGGYMIQVPASQSWARNAEVYNQEYHLGVTKDFLLARRQYALKVQALMRKPLPSGGPTTPPSEVDISSVDDAEQLVSPVRKCGNGELLIQDVSIGVQTLTRQMYCFFWTFRNKIELSLVYNENFYDIDYPAELLVRLKGVLEKELQF